MRCGGSTSPGGVARGQAAVAATAWRRATLVARKGGKGPWCVRRVALSTGTLVQVMRPIASAISPHLACI